MFGETHEAEYEENDQDDNFGNGEHVLGFAGNLSTPNIEPDKSGADKNRYYQNRPMVPDQVEHRIGQPGCIFEEKFPEITGETESI